MSITSISMSDYCFHVDIIGRPSCVTDSVGTYASQAAKSVRVVTPPGINEAVLRLCCVYNCDNHLTRFNKIAIQGTPQMAVD